MKWHRLKYTTWSGVGGVSREAAPDPQSWEVAACPRCGLAGTGVLRGEGPQVSGCGEPAGRGGGGRAHTAALLIRVVPTVVVIIALPATWHATVVLAAELVGLAGTLV